MRKSILRVQARAVAGRGAVLHASAVSLNGRGLLFLAPSGGGKSTAAAILGSRGFEVLGDDSTVVCMGTDGVWRVIPCASWSWQSKTERQAHELGALVLLEKGEPPLLKKLAPLYAAYRIRREGSLMALGDLPETERPPLRASVADVCRGFPAFALRYSLPVSLERMMDDLAGELH